MLIRTYVPGEEAELWELFFNTVHRVNSRDYSRTQLEAWAPDQCDTERWRSRIESMDPIVCIIDGTIVGYAGLLDSGCIDHFYVHHQWQRQGIGGLLMQGIEANAREQQLTQLTVDVSITAKPFFESRGFSIVAPQEVTLGEVVLNNFKMSKKLGTG